MILTDSCFENMQEIFTNRFPMVNERFAMEDWPPLENAKIVIPAP